MKNSTSISMPYAVFEKLCMMHKEKGGVLNKTIAIDMGIDFSVFSKLLSGKREITDIYKNKIFNYFSQDSFSIYCDDLKQYACSILKLTTSCSAYTKITSKSYKELIYYLLFEFTQKDMLFDETLRQQFIYYVRKYFYHMLETSSNQCGGCQIIESPYCITLENRLGLPPNHVMEIARPLPAGTYQKVFILLCPEHWHNSLVLIRDTDLIESADCYMMIRLNKSCLENLYEIKNNNEASDNPVNIETLHVGKLCHNAQLLAEMIFAKLCENVTDIEKHYQFTC